MIRKLPPPVAGEPQPKPLTIREIRKVTVCPATSTSAARIQRISKPLKLIRSGIVAKPPQPSPAASSSPLLRPAEKPQAIEVAALMAAVAGAGAGGQSITTWTTTTSSISSNAFTSSSPINPTETPPPFSYIQPSPFQRNPLTVQAATPIPSTTQRVTQFYNADKVGAQSPIAGRPDDDDDGSKQSDQGPRPPQQENDQRSKLCFRLSVDRDGEPQLTISPVNRQGPQKTVSLQDYVESVVIQNAIAASPDAERCLTLPSYRSLDLPSDFLPVADYTQLSIGAQLPNAIDGISDKELSGSDHNELSGSDDERKQQKLLVEVVGFRKRRGARPVQRFVHSGSGRTERGSIAKIGRSLRINRRRQVSRSDELRP